MNNSYKESTNKNIKIICAKCENIIEYLIISGKIMCYENENPHKVSNEVIKRMNNIIN